MDVDQTNEDARHENSENDNVKERNLLADMQTDQIYELIRDFLPDIEGELRKEISDELEHSYQRKYQDLMEQTKEETRKQIDSIIEEIKTEAFSSYNERIKSLEVKENELIQLRNEYKDVVEKEIKEELKQEFEKEKEILLKTVIEEMNKEKSLEECELQLREKLKNDYSEELRKELQRKEKLLNVNMKKRLDQEKKTLQESYDLEWKNRIDDAKKELERERNEINRLKSLENIRMKKLEEEKKIMKKEVEEQKLKYEAIIKDLKSQLESKEKLNKTDNFHNNHDEINEKDLKNNNISNTGNTGVSSGFNTGNTAEIYNSGKNKENDNEFEKKYLQNNGSVKKSSGGGIRLKGSPEFDRFLQKETWNRVEEMIEPLSPPKLLYFDEEKVITYSEEASQFHEKTINNMSIFKEKSNINTINYNNSNNNNNESKEIVKKPRILIGEYNSKQIAEEIIKIYSEKKTMLDNQKTADLSKIISKSVINNEIPQKNNESLEKSNNFNNNTSENYNKSNIYETNHQNNNMLTENEVSGLKERKISENTSFLYEREQIRKEKKNKKIEEFSQKYKKILKNDGKKSKMPEESEDGNKYKEIIKKFIKKDNINKTNKNFVVDENNKVNKYESLFLLTKNDDNKVKDMKKLRKEIFTRLIRDYNLEEKYLAMEIYLKNQMLRNLSKIFEFSLNFIQVQECENIEHYGQIQNNTNILIECWILNDTSYKERIDFIMALENMLGEGEEINKKIEFEIDFQQNYHKISFNLIEKLKERTMLRNKLNIDDFSYNSNKKIYSFLRNLSEQIDHLLDEYEETQEKAFIWRGIDVRDLIKCEAWEQEYLEKEEMRKELYSKIKKKIL